MKATILAEETDLDRLGCWGHNAARALSSGRSRVIGLVTLATNFYSRSALSLGIETSAREAGYVVSQVSVVSLAAGDVEDALSRLADQGVDGIILGDPLVLVSAATEAFTRRIPTVTVDGSRTPSTELVAIDQSMATQLATQHLLDLGHATVWHLARPIQWLDASSRKVAGNPPWSTPDGRSHQYCTATGHPSPDIKTD